jgi:predicted DNA-binding transcriptional regulator YafY
VEPAGLLTADGRWYLIAWCRTRRAGRGFRLDRIATATPAGEQAQPHDLTKLADHLVQRHVVPKISRETLRRILRSGKVSWHARAEPKTNFASRLTHPSVDAIPGQGGVTRGYATSRSTLIASITTAVVPWMP